MNLLKDLNELISENVISKEIAHNIESFTKQKKKTQPTNYSLCLEFWEQF